jgi:UDP-N-acetylglucosamine 2-epimerase (non-hydrolysing)/GDP/UDP-N,N'-diacetylbacillosamine 2-epimerase (hydrolysing)
MSTKRRIGVITTSRADYGHLYWPLRELSARPDVELGIFALGAHLSPEFGSTLEEIESDGFRIQARIECLLSSDTDTGMAKTIGVAILGLADALTVWRPDILLLIADRYEMLAPASVALALRIPMAHIEGGEVSQGAIDDQVRNALTKLAHIHFTSTPTARRRVIAMGEEPSRVYRAGAPSLDHLRRSALLDPATLEAKLGLKLTPPAILAAWHPVTILRDTNAEADALFAALTQAPGQLIFVYPNSDAGSHALIERTKQLAAARPHTHIFVNLDAVTYWSLLGQMDAMVGNSSSGIMEAASFALPVVNVGMRQQGRERAANIIDVPAETPAILTALNRALSQEFRASLNGMVNPYGDGTAAKTIVHVLTAAALEGLLIKQPAPLPADTYPEQTIETMAVDPGPSHRFEHGRKGSPLEIVVDPGSITKSQKGTIFGLITFVLAEKTFPSPGWTDLVVAFMGVWLEGIVLVLSGQRNHVRVHFYDGPYSIDLSSTGDGSADLEFIRNDASGDQLVAALRVRLRELMKQSMDAGERVAEICQQRDWTNPDTRMLSATLRSATKALARAPGVERP